MSRRREVEVAVFTVVVDADTPVNADLFESGLRAELEDVLAEADRGVGPVGSSGASTRRGPTPGTNVLGMIARAIHEEMS